MSRYDPSKRSINIPELRKELASPTGVAGQAAYLTGRQADVEDALTAGLLASHKDKGVMLTTRFTEAQKHLASILSAMEAAGEPNDELMQMYQRQQANAESAEAEMTQHFGLSVKDSRQTYQIIFDLLEQMSKDPGKFDEHATWNNATYDLIKRTFTDLGLDPPKEDHAKALWEGRILTMGYAGGEVRGAIGSSDAPESPTNVTARVDQAFAPTDTPTDDWFLGTLGAFPPVDFDAPYAIPSAVQALGKKVITGPSVAPTDTTPRIITPTDQKKELGPFGVLGRIPDMQKFIGRGGGMIDTGAQFMADTLIPEAAADTSVIGSQATEELQAMDEEAAGALTDEAIAFLKLLEQFIAQYGRERAIELLSEEWSELKDADRRSVEKYLRQ